MIALWLPHHIFRVMASNLECVGVQNDKRQLETAMVVESRIRNKNRVPSRRSLGEAGDAFDLSEVRPRLEIYRQQPDDCQINPFVACRL